MSKFTFQYEPVQKLLDDGLHAMAYQHWLEGSREFEYNPNWESYKCLEAENVFRILAVRYDGKLAGYAGIRIFQNLQSRDVTCAYLQEYYIDPKYRPKGGGLDLLRTIEKHLKLMKVKRMLVEVPTEVEEVGKVFVHLGYKPQGKLMGKTL